MKTKLFYFVSAIDSEGSKHTFSFMPSETAQILSVIRRYKIVTVERKFIDIKEYKVIFGL